MFVKGVEGRDRASDRCAGRHRSRRAPRSARADRQRHAAHADRRPRADRRAPRSREPFPVGGGWGGRLGRAPSGGDGCVYRPRRAHPTSGCAMRTARTCTAIWGETAQTSIDGLVAFRISSSGAFSNRISMRARGSTRRRSRASTGNAMRGLRSAAARHCKESSMTGLTIEYGVPPARRHAARAAPLADTGRTAARCGRHPLRRRHGRMRRRRRARGASRVRLRSPSRRCMQVSRCWPRAHLPRRRAAAEAAADDGRTDAAARCRRPRIRRRRECRRSR